MPGTIDTMERDTIFYLLDRNTPERAFVSGVVVGGGLDELVIQFERADLGVAVGEIFPLYYKNHDQFLEREYESVRVTADAGGTRVKVRPRESEPRRGDLRASERIPTISESLVARLAYEHDCLVLDISTSGLAVVGGGVFAIGDVVPFEMWARGRHFVGEVMVRNVIEIRDGRFRYGLKCNADRAGHNLQNSLPQLWVALQIKYLESLTG